MLPPEESLLSCDTILGGAVEPSSEAGPWGSLLFFSLKERLERTLGDGGLRFTASGTVPVGDLSGLVAGGDQLAGAVLGRGL